MTGFHRDIGEKGLTQRTRQFLATPPLEFEQKKHEFECQTLYLAGRYTKAERYYIEVMKPKNRAERNAEVNHKRQRSHHFEVSGR